VLNGTAHRAPDSVAGRDRIGGRMFIVLDSVGAGVLIGALLAWINFRWLKSALDTVTRAATAQSEASKARVPLGSGSA